ncbi:MAG: sulfatase-like hydrolase/transferase [Planctomycetes bacterium]|nr:sulfatase-like hydrolase/transferase [Planctomycetota bacterium]
MQFKHLSMLAVLLTMCVPAMRSQGAEKPNILYIFADDLCFETINALGYSEVQTPNLDRLVTEGTTFTHAYNMGAWQGAVCVSSRTMLNTGRFLWRADAVKDHLGEEAKGHRMWSQIMSDAGYETYMTGKWHVRIEPKSIFDHVKDERPGMPNQTPAGYNRPVEGEPMKWHPWDEEYGGYWKGGKHWSEVLRDDTLEFIDAAKNSDKPCFMYIAFNAAHDPRQSPKEYVERYKLDDIAVPVNFMPVNPFHEAMGLGPASPKALRDEALAPFPRTDYAVKVNRQEYYALITHMDTQIGMILDALDKSGKRDNTWIIFTADHGLAVGQHGLMGKQSMYDHSVRVPFMIVGPGVAKGAKIDTRIYLQDAMATAIDLAGAPKPEHVEFKSLLPLLHGEKDAHYGQTIYGAYMHFQRMITDGDWKLILYPNAKSVLLFNITDDPNELHNLADDASQKARIHGLFEKLLELQKQMDDKLDLKATYPSL